ncbi:polysaccharide biosynthesis/export family protein [Vulgatibacter sp.]|uniref:polysaccharide biosynthesis/export family protein n=1 Tax=Vulgatibacter sp. TaxID=1971226 RepID=UPI00356198C9
MLRSSIGLLLVASLGFSAGCASREARMQANAATAAPAAEVAAPAAAQTLGSGDVFEVRVVGEEDLSGAYRVASDGSVSFPFCGRIEVGGKTAPETSEALTSCLAAGYIKNPQVSVFIKERHSKKVFVFGEVQKPGTFLFEDGMNVIQAITLAEGFGKLAASNSVVVTRIVDGQEQRYKVRVDDIGTGKSANFLLQPGDIVYVPESFF